MESSQGLASTSENEALSLSFSSLVDAMRYTKNRSELMTKIDDLKNRDEKITHGLDPLCNKFSAEIETLSEDLGKELTEELSRQVVNFSGAAIKLIREKSETQNKKLLEEYLLLAENEKAQSLNELATFLSTNLLRVKDHVTVVKKLIDATYRASERFECQGDIRYEFLLDSNGSSLFGGERATIQVMKSEIKLPVRISKSRLKKEPIVDFVRLDQYSLDSAEATETTLTARYVAHKGNSEVKMAYSKEKGTVTSLAVEYSDAAMIVDVSSNPLLRNHLDTEAISLNMDRIRDGLSDLEHHKTSLAKLTFRQKSIIENLEDSEFFDECWNALAPKITEALKKSTFDRKLTNGENGINEIKVRENLKLLGSQGESILRKIGLASD